MKVLHVYRTYYPDPPRGIPEVIRQICLSTRAFDVRSTVFTLSPTPHPALLEYPEGPVQRERSWLAPGNCDLGGPAALASFRRLARDADVVHYHYPWPFADLLDLVAGLRTPAVLTYHSDVVRQQLFDRLYDPLRRRHLDRVAAIIATSAAYVASSPLLALPRYRGRLVTIPLGIAEPAEALGRARQAAPRADRPYFFFVGALGYYKGLTYLIDAAARTGLDVIIAGSGPEEANLRGRCAELGVGSVQFAGLVDDDRKLALMAGARAVVLPSHLRSEAFGVALIEASMLGRPMICCEIGTGTSFVNVDGVTGIVVPPQDAAALGDALRRLADDRSQAEAMGARSRQRYEALFSGAALGRAHARLYANVVDGRAPGHGLDEPQDPR